MGKAYMWTKGGYEGCSFGEKIYLSKEKAELDLLKEQGNPDSAYYNHPMDDFYWEVEEFELDETQ